MKKLISSVVLGLSLTSCGPLDLQSIKTQTDSGIYGGQDVAPEDKIQNSIVGVYDSRTGTLCTGTLLKNNIVLTAAHCLGIDTADMKVYFGADMTETGYDEKNLRQVDKMEASPYSEYRRTAKYSIGDIALLHFQGDVPERYRPVMVLPKPEFLHKDAVIYVAGYGVNDPNQSTGMGILRKTILTILEPEYRPYSADRDNFPITEATVMQDDGQGTCHGDSGGPAFVIANNQYFLWGVISGGINRGSQKCDGKVLITNALIYKSWINKTAKSLVGPLEEMLVDTQ